MVRAAVTDVGGRFESWGPCEFVAMPRIGEHITRDLSGTNYVYRVLDVQHAGGTPGRIAIDIYVTKIGRLDDHLRHLHAQAVMI